MNNKDIIKKCEQMFVRARVKCKCGHSVIFPNKEDRIICGWCGHYVYKNDKAKFKYKLKEEMNKK